MIVLWRELLVESGDQADISQGGSPSVVDQSMENDQSTKVLAIESQTLHGITILEKGNMGLTLLKTDQGYLVVKSIDQNSPAELSGLRHGDVLCCPGTNGNNVTKWNTLISNMKNTENRPLYVEVWRQVNPDDVLSDLKKEYELHNAGCEEAKLLRNVLSQQLKKISCPSIHLFNLTHHLMKNAPMNGDIPKVLTELLQHVVFKMTDHGPNYSSVTNGDNQRWKIQCSKCHKYMSEVEYDLPVCFAICPLIILLHNGLVHSSFLDLTWFDENLFHKSALQYLFSSFQAYETYIERFVKKTLTKSPNEKNNQSPHLHVDDINMCQYCSGHFISPNSTTEKEKILCETYVQFHWSE